MKPHPGDKTTNKTSTQHQHGDLRTPTGVDLAASNKNVEETIFPSSVLACRPASKLRIDHQLVYVPSLLPSRHPQHPQLQLQL